MTDKYIGKTISDYLVLEKIGKSTDGHGLYKARCVRCGFTFRHVRINTLKRSAVKSCKNHNQKIIPKWKNKYLAGIFRGMKERCYNTSCPSYRFYGLKGIGIYREWIQNPSSFETWAFQNGYSTGLSIDRIDSSKDYSPQNCRWITMKQNAKWKSTTNAITVNGITDSGRGWSKRLGCGVNRVNKMLREKGIKATKEWIKTRIIA